MHNSEVEYYFAIDYLLDDPAKSKEINFGKTKYWLSSRVSSIVEDCFVKGNILSDIHWETHFIDDNQIDMCFGSFVDRNGDISSSGKQMPYEEFKRFLKDVSLITYLYYTIDG